MGIRLSFLFLAFLAISSCASLSTGSPHSRKTSAPGVSVYRSLALHTGIRGLEPQASIQFSPAASSLPADLVLPTFEIDPLQLRQSMDGFGATLTESCAINLTKLPPKLRRETLENIFSKTSGAGFDLLRLPMGSTDFSDSKAGNYTYDDSPKSVPDPSFKHFNMDRDEKSFSIIREARAINPHLKVMISPWSPPAWMKTGRLLNGGGLDPDYYQDFANYFVRSINEYKLRAIPVTMMTIQNEPGYATSDYPTMGLSPDEQIKFISKYLGPTLEREHVNVRLFAHDHNWDQVADVNTILDDVNTKKYVSGVAYHCYGGYRWQMYDSMNRHPTIPTLQNECSGSTWNDPQNDFHWWLDNQSVGAVNMGTTGALGWNLCLDEKSGPKNGGCDGCRGMVTTDFSKPDANVIYNPEFYALAQVSRFIVPSSRRLEIKASGVKAGNDALESTAFLNPNGSFVFVAQNPSTIEEKFRVLLNGQFLTYSLPAKSAVTMVWR